MANRKDLLSEAIADAKAVKETALANAKLALEEAFTPKLQSMISAKLAEEADEEMEEELDSSDLGSGDNAEPADDANDSSEVTEFKPVAEVLKNKLIACQPFCFWTPYWDIELVKLSEQFGCPK